MINLKKNNNNKPVFLFEVLVQLKLIVYGADSSHKLLVLPGVGCCDAIGPQGEERHRTCTDSLDFRTRSCWFVKRFFLNSQEKRPSKSSHLSVESR